MRGGAGRGAGARPGEDGGRLAATAAAGARRGGGWGGRGDGGGPRRPRACTHSPAPAGSPLAAAALAAASRSSPSSSAGAAAVAQAGPRSPSASGSRSAGAGGVGVRPPARWGYRRPSSPSALRCRDPRWEPPRAQRAEIAPPAGGDAPRLQAACRGGPRAVTGTLVPDAPRRLSPPLLPPSQLCPGRPSLCPHTPHCPPLRGTAEGPSCKDCPVALFFQGQWPTGLCLPLRRSGCPLVPCFKVRPQRLHPLGTC